MFTGLVPLGSLAWTMDVDRPERAGCRASVASNQKLSHHGDVERQAEAERETLLLKDHATNKPDMTHTESDRQTDSTAYPGLRKYRRWKKRWAEFSG